MFFQVLFLFAYLDFVKPELDFVNFGIKVRDGRAKVGVAFGADILEIGVALGGKAAVVLNESSAGAVGAFVKSARTGSILKFELGRSRSYSRNAEEEESTHVGQ